MERLWNIAESPPQSFFDEHPELPTAIGTILYHRGLRTQAQLDEFLNPEYTKDVHDPFLFNDMEKAVRRLFEAIEKKETITIHGDYDADGVSASVILTDTLRALGAHSVNVYLPHRETDGYGLNSKTVELLHERGTNVIITCDCGISNAPEVARANELGIDVIVTDHHSIPETLPEAHAIIHPKVETESYPDKNLAGGGVAFKLAQGLLKTDSRLHETLQNGQAHDGFEKWLLGMVAIASVADMVPLIGESRTLTKYGLIVLNKTRRIGMQKLLLNTRLTNDLGVLNKEIDARAIGFQIAPRINAAGRMDHANVAYQLLVEHDPAEAARLAALLEKNNTDRREMTDTFVDQAMQMIDSAPEAKVLGVFHEDWSTGITGLIASRLKESYQKPSIAITTNGEKITGSGRSVPGFNLVEALQGMPQHFEKFGGHPMACGFTLKSKDVLETFLVDLQLAYDTQTKDLDMRPTLAIDAEISLADVDWELYDLLERCAPFGQANPRPCYAVKGLTVIKSESMGKDGSHLRLLLGQGEATPKKAIGWGLCDKARKESNGKDWSMELNEGDSIDLVFEVSVNEWNGNRELQLMIRDIRKS